MFRKLMIPLDGSPLAEQALGRGVAIARACGAELELVLVHQPLPFDGLTDAPSFAQLVDMERDYLAAIAAEVTSAGCSARHSLLRGEAAEMICEHVGRCDADLVVMTTHARTGVNRAWLGSVTDGIVRHANVPVLVLRPVEGVGRHEASRHLFRRVLVPVDGSITSGEILAPATALARCTTNAALTLLQVVEPIPLISLEAGLPFANAPSGAYDATTRRIADDAREQLTETARQVQEQSGLTVSAQVVVEAPVSGAILEFARTGGADLIAMATHGRGLSRFLMGSVADKVMRAGTLPVLLYRPSPVRRRSGSVGAEATSVLSPA